MMNTSIVSGQEWSCALMQMIIRRYSVLVTTKGPSWSRATYRNVLDAGKEIVFYWFCFAVYLSLRSRSLFHPPVN